MPTNSDAVTLVYEAKIDEAIANLVRLRSEMGTIDSQAAKTTKTAGESFKGFTENVKKNFAELAAITAGVFLTIKESVESVALAADFDEQAETMEKRFGVLSSTIVDKMGKASKGMVSDMQLMKLSSRAMTLDVSTDVNDLAKLMEFAEVQAKGLGKSTEDVFSGMADAIGKQNPRMLRELGFTKQEIQNLGGEMGAIPTKSELLTAVLKKGEEAVRRFGDENLSAADKMQQIKVAVENAKKNLGEGLLPVFGVFMPVIKDFLTGFSSIPGSVKAVGVALLAVVPAIYAVWTALGPVGLVLTGISVAVAGFVVAQGRAVEAVKKARAEAVAYMAEMDKQMGVEINRAKVREEEIRQIRERIRGAKDMAEAEDRLNAIMAEKAKYAEDEKRRYENAANLYVRAKNELSSYQAELRAQGKAESDVQDEMGRVTDSKLSDLQKIMAARRREYETHKANMVAAEEATRAAGEELRTRKQGAEDWQNKFSEVSAFVRDLDKKAVDERVKKLDEYLEFLKRSGMRESELYRKVSAEKAEIESKNGDEIQKKCEDAMRKYLSYLKTGYEQKVAIEDQRLEEERSNLERMQRDNIIDHQQYLSGLRALNDQYAKNVAKIWFDEASDVIAAIGKASDLTLRAVRDLATLVNKGMSDDYTALKNQMEALDERYSATKRARDAEDYATQKAILEKEIADAGAAGNTRLADEKALQLKRLTEDRNYQTKKEALEADARAKERSLKKTQWAIDKAASIAKTIIDTAAGVVASLTLPPPLSFVMAGITGAMGAVETGIIASQPEPAFAGGGTVTQHGLSTVGERGPEHVRLPLGTQVMPSSASRQITNNSQTTNNQQRSVVIHNVLANDPIEFVNKIRRETGNGVL